MRKYWEWTGEASRVGQLIFIKKFTFGWLEFMCDAGTLGAKVESVLEFVNRAVRKMVSVFQFPIQYFPTEILTISLTIAGQY